MEKHKRGEMTPQEKALKLYDIYMDEMIEKEAYFVESAAKQCALLAVDEIISAIDWHEFETPNKEIEYWQEVKTEIEKL